MTTPDDVRALAEQIGHECEMLAQVHPPGSGRKPDFAGYIEDALAAALPGWLAERAADDTDALRAELDLLRADLPTGDAIRHEMLQQALAENRRLKERAAGGDHADLIERLGRSHKMIGEMCSEGRPPKMSIPARRDRDEDFLICDALRDAIDALSQERAAGGLDAAAEAAVDELVNKTLAWQGRREADVARARAALAPFFANRPESPDSSWPELLRIAGEALSDFDSLPEDQQDAGALAQALSDHGMPARVTEPTPADLIERLEGLDLGDVTRGLNRSMSATFHEIDVRDITRAVLAELGRAHTHTDGPHD